MKAPGTSGLRPASSEGILCPIPGLLSFDHSGESYGGVYVPLLASKLLEANKQAGGSGVINLKVRGQAMRETQAGVPWHQFALHNEDICTGHGL